MALVSNAPTMPAEFRGPRPHTEAFLKGWPEGERGDPDGKPAEQATWDRYLEAEAEAQRLDHLLALAAWPWAYARMVLAASVLD